MAIPMVGVDGVRQTVNANLTPAQTTWNLRSALNVAALNCLGPSHAAILPNYKSFLDRNVRKLSATNRALQSEFRQKYGPTYRDVQDSYMTQVYNYFALPPAIDEFCDAALAVSTEALAVESADLDLFAARSLPRIESVFEDFFRSYEQYRIDLAAWNSEYGPPSIQTTVAGYANPLDPAVNVAPGTTVVGTMPATSPVVVAGNPVVPVEAPPAAPPVIQLPAAAPTTPSTPTQGISEPLPTQGVIFRSGEVVQGGDANSGQSNAEPTVTGDTDSPGP